MSGDADDDERAYLARYDPAAFARPNVSVDAAVFTVRDGRLQVLVVERDEHPFRGRWSLVGGFVDLDRDRDVEATAMRKLHEKTGVAAPYLEQFGAAGDAVRDPRGWSVTVIYFALISAVGVRLRPGPGATDIRWTPVADRAVREPLAFDHAAILAACVDRLRSRVSYTSLPVYLLPETFTLREVQETYEIVLGRALEPKAFRRRMLAVDVLEETGEMRRERTRPAKLYRVARRAPHVFVRTIESA